ncbi:MAG TPA: glycoside hydrolase N-terminal domain-containing protein [Acidobacteriaceae bacterium]|nr:glycoside hydrolase N-terminal domain-containing protein [Acidobacteriaceae bacterium]
MPRISRRRFLRDAALGGAFLATVPRFASASEPRTAIVEPDWNQFRLWFQRPAPSWPDALPVGNGRLGAMVFGSPSLERVQLNEESIWDGERRDRDNPRASAAVPEIRRLLFEGKVHEAEAMAVSDMLSIPRRMPCYQTLGDLYLDFTPSGLAQSAGASLPTDVTDYTLELDLDRAIVTTSFTRAGMRHTREVFSSAPDQVIVVRLSVSKPGALAFVAHLDRPGDHSTDVIGSDGLVLTGEALPVHDNPGLPVKERQTGIRFHARMRVHAEGGSVTVAPGNREHPAQLQVTGANTATLYMDCATSFRYPAGEQAMAAAVQRNLHAAARRPYAELRTRHISDYRAYFRRASIEIDAREDANQKLPTDVRLRRVKEGGTDLGLFPVYFQFGRYLLISSSRPGTLAANLQGIWNESVDPPWGSKYTININAEMNYWIADRTALGDLHTPFFDLLDSTRAAGSRVAKSYYKARGVVVHHNTDIWGDAGPIDGLGGGIWPMGAAWMSTQLWDHYLYTGDREFLRDRAYPRLREVAIFLLDYLTPSPEGHLVTGPSCSPENAYRLPDGSRANLCMAPTMDIEITRAIFDKASHAAQILGVDEALRTQMAAAASRLPSYKIGRYGNLQEWQEDYDEVEPGHRHISHLWALYPDDQITLRDAPKLAQACRVALDRRLEHGGGSTGWSRAWVINCFARLEDGDRCHQQLTELLRLSTRENLFDVCGIKQNSYYQIDGNLGAPAGMAEMLLQSHRGIIRLLAALPSAWPDGRFAGLRARGGLAVDLAWREGKAENATLHALRDGEHVLAAPRGQRIEAAPGTHSGFISPAGEGQFRIRVRRGETYHLRFV